HRRREPAGRVRSRRRCRSCLRSPALACRRAAAWADSAASCAVGRSYTSPVATTRSPVGSIPSGWTSRVLIRTAPQASPAPATSIHLRSRWPACARLRGRLWIAGILSARCLGVSARDSETDSLQCQPRPVYGDRMARLGPTPVGQPPLLALPPHPGGLPWPTNVWPVAEIDPRVDRARLDRLLNDAFGAAESDDLGRTNAVVVVQHGAIVAERYRQDVDADRAFISWSMAKSITSCLVGILVGQGRLDIAQPIPVKEWGAGDKRRRITIDQMLRMTDGLRFREAENLGDGSVRYYPADESDVIPMLFGVGKDDVAAFAATLPYQVEPESRWNYNSGGSNLLARLVSEVIGGGEPEMRAFMKRELFDRIGM